MLSGLKFNAPKCETNARLCLGRIRLLKNKKNMQMRQYRRDIADLLKAGKLDYAIIRVESVIREQLTLTAYEILELYLELVAVRATMVAQSKTIPGDMMEALSSVLYASARCPELEELVKLRAMFEQKYGKEYVGCALSDRECHRFSVNERLIRCLTVEPPPPDLKLQTLSEIAQEYAVEWDASEARRVLLGEVGSIAYAPMPPASQQQQQQQQSGAPAATGPVTGLVLRPSDETLDLLGPPVRQQPQQQPAAAAAAGSGGYADVAAAAQAAARAAQEAQAAAAAAAAMVAAGRGGGPAGGAAGGGGGGGGGGTPAPLHPPVGPPQQGWLAKMENFQHIQPGSAPTATAAAAGSTASTASGTTGSSAAGGTGGTCGTAAAGGFKVPSAEEIQRAYDQAQGPPPKPNLMGGTDAAAAAGPGGGASSSSAAASSRQMPMAPPPAAPPVKASEEDIAAAAGTSSATSSGSGGALDLPSVPGGRGGSSGGGAAAGGGSSSAASDFDELQKRFEALKKS